jgi:hydroxyethylthiazole kinase-like sugar kinase family protein
MKITFFMLVDAGHGEYKSPILSYVDLQAATKEDALHGAISEIQKLAGIEWQSMGIDWE